MLNLWGNIKIYLHLQAVFHSNKLKFGVTHPNRQWMIILSSILSNICGQIGDLGMSAEIITFDERC